MKKRIVALFLACVMVCASFVNGSQLVTDAAESLKGSSIPEDVVLSDLLVTKGTTDSMLVNLASQGATNLGNLYDDNEGFAYKVTIPKTPGDQITVIYRSTNSSSTWVSGIYVTVNVTSSGKYQLILGSRQDGSASDVISNLTVVEQDITLAVWHEKAEDGAITAYLALDGKVVCQCTWAAGSKVQLGRAVVAECEGTAKYVKALGDYEGSIPVKLEDLAQTKGANSVPVERDASASLGILDSTQNGFQVKFTLPSNTNTFVNIGYCNTVQGNAWQGGYTLSIQQRGTSAQYYVYKGTGSATIGSNICKEWSSATASGEVTVALYRYLYTLNGVLTESLFVYVNGVRSGRYDNTAGSEPTLGKYVNVSTNNTAVTLNTIYEVMDTENASFGIDAELEDLLMTNGATESTVSTGSQHLGNLSASSKGFVFRVAVPEKGKQVVIGYANNQATNSWAGGYRLTAWRNGANTICYYVSGANENRIVAENATVPTGEMLVALWVTEEGDQRTIHLSVNGQKIGTGTHGKDVVKTGTYLTSEYAGEAFTVKSINQVDTVSAEEFNANYALDSAGNRTKAPTKDGYVFAGWFKDVKCKTSVGKEVVESGNVYAKFVEEDALTVKAQLKLDNGEVPSDKTDMRFVTTVDSALYQYIGFTIQIGNGKVVDAEGENRKYSVYKKLYALGSNEEVDDVFPKAFSLMSSYFKVWTLKSIPAKHYGTDIKVTPYFITLDGTRVEGSVRRITVNEGLAAYGVQ